MSTTSSISNFYVDLDGIEQPIPYEAKDLVNKLAPTGYHWEQDLRYYLAEKKRYFEDSSVDELKFYLTYPKYPNPVMYICVRDVE